MSDSDRWLLPEGIEEVLPGQAERLESLRRRLLDLFQCWGYELVVPPLIEYLESLLTGSGNDLGLQTFKLIDQLSGRMMGVRADMTPQVARIEANHLQRQEPVRLCYMGTVLRTDSDGFASSRSPMQLGAELYGHAGVEADVEVLCLMLEMLDSVGLSDVHLDIGHVGIYRGLARSARLTAAQESEFFDLLQRKARPEIETYLGALDIDAELRGMLAAIATLNGGSEVLDIAAEVLRSAGQEVLDALANLRQIADAAAQRLPDTPLYYDLAELRGYHYKTGVVFAAFVPGCGQEVARGGRYDDIGAVFGRARPATGFGADLKLLMRLSGKEHEDLPSGVFAPAEDDQMLLQLIAALRRQGERVVQALPGQRGGAVAMGCDRQLNQVDGEWRVETVR